MPDIQSQLELPGSPVEQSSWATSTYFWDPSGELDAGETISNPTVKVLKYDPGNAGSPLAYTDVTSTVCPGGAFIGQSAHANQIGVTIQGLTAGYEYRVEVGFEASAAHEPGKFFVIKCLL